jgi:hypothetical protein
MANLQLEIFQEFERLLPAKWFAPLREGEGPLYPFVWGVCGALADLRASLMAVQQQVLPQQAEGFWLSLHMLGIGLQRTSAETDPQALQRYKFEFQSTRNTRAGLLRYIEAISGLSGGAVRLETDFEAGRYGYVRLVIDSLGTDYQSVGWDWPRRVLAVHIANGLQPAVDVSLRNLIAAPLPPWRFETPFPMGPGQLGPLYDRPALTNELRLIDLSRNHIAWLTPQEWSLLPLGRIFADTHSAGQPGAQFAYLVDPIDDTPAGSPGGRFMEVNYLPPQLLAGEIEFGARAFGVDGFKFDDLFPRDGNQQITEEVTTEIRIYGSDPSLTTQFPGQAEGFPVFRLESGSYTLPPASDWVLVAETFAVGPHRNIPREWVVPGDRFGHLRPFPHNQQWSTTTETVTRQIPDSTQVEFWEPQAPTVSTLEAWRMRGNYWVPTEFLEPVGHTLPLATDYELSELQPEGDRPRFNFDEGTPKVCYFLPDTRTTKFIEPAGHITSTAAGDFIDPAGLTYLEPAAYRFNQRTQQLPNRYFQFGSYSFPSTADPSQTYEVSTPVAPVHGYIPNVRAPFTRQLIVEWFEVQATLEEPQTPDSLQLMGRGPWTLRLGAGNPGWGMTPPAGISPLQNEFAALDPSSIWWTDEAGVLKDSKPYIDVDGVAYLAVEFLLPKGVQRVLRELELRIGYPQPDPGGADFEVTYSLPEAEAWGEPTAHREPDGHLSEQALNLQLPVLEIVHYRRVALTINADVNFGIVFRIATKLRDPQISNLPAFRTGQSRSGEVLRDRDYVYVL